ncbi:type II secretion system protein [Thalassotalea piscium]
MRQGLLAFKGFTLIELMIVMSVVALLLTMVGPLAVNNLEKAQAKQEMLSLKNWLSKISYQAYASGHILQLTLAGKKATLAKISAEKKIITTETFEYIFFTPQVINFSRHGIVYPSVIKGEFKDNKMELNLKVSINGEDITHLEDINP